MNKQEAKQKAESQANQPPFESQIVYKLDGKYGIAPSSVGEGVLAVAEYITEVSPDFRNMVVEE
jgi:hypothetical protein